MSNTDQEPNHSVTKLETENEQVEEDDDNDEEIFIQEGEAVEVELNDDDVPMEDDDDDDDGVDEAAMPDDDFDGEHGTASNQIRQENIPDMSVITMDSHKLSSIYAVASNYNIDRNCLSILTGGGDDRAFFHKIDMNSLSLQTLGLSHEHSDSVSCVATNEKYVSDDMTKTPKYLAVGGYDGNIVLYNAENGEKIQTLDGPTDVEFLCFHPKGGSVLLAGSIADATVWMYHLPTSKCLQVFVGHECNGESGGVTAGSFTPDGKFALTVGMDGTMRLWAPRTGMCRHTFKLTEEDDDGEGTPGLICLAVDGGVEGQLAVAGGENGNAYVVHLQAKKVVGTLHHFDSMQSVDAMGEMASVEAVGFAPRDVNPNWVATGGSDGVLKIWDLTMDGGQCRQSCLVRGENGTPVATGGITRLRWHPNLPMIFASYTDGAVRLWDARSGNLIHTLTGGKADNQINDFSVETLSLKQEPAADVLVITAYDDGTAKVFRVNLGDIVSRTY